MNRNDLVQQLKDDPEIWDFIIIGGGATGLGTAVEAASRGYRTLLLEQHDFAKGTSSRSTKLVHGGVRYLRQGNVALVLEALRERGLLRKNAPHLVKNQSFIVPNYDWWEGPFYGIGLKIYDKLAGDLGLGPSKHLSKEETLKYIPTLEPEDLNGGVIYHDAQFDDSRLAVNLMQTLFDHGGVGINYMKVTGLLKANGLVTGVKVEDQEDDNELEIQGRVVVNATGIFTDSIRKMDDPTNDQIIQPSQGVHIVLDKSFQPGESAIMVPKTDDGRVLFAVPWHNRIIVGTTDTPLEEPSLEPRAQEEEIEFLLTHAARYLTKDPGPEDVLSVFAGLRPLVSRGGSKDTSSISRDHTLLIDPSGLVTITGGKWTTYRKMAEDTVNEAALVAGLDERESNTENLRLHGWLKNSEAAEPFEMYGSDALSLKKIADQNPGWDQPIHENLPYSPAEVVWAVRSEMARTVEDVLARRTRALLLDARASIEMADTVAELMAAELNTNGQWKKQQVEEYTELAKGYLL
ncbi:glycerol-3-phosphate dehydrogenase/oxidase [Aliifodinibius sp. S!AR15-10]|uniref:glycerol-3-phosphate dehydrogenase/oxidase n=1 Tax=Aliifodinibius sp. S!AR15-10 TaxID=2950437 RepID=UPI002864A480|nr:glycerol-3-phosphate dehydrogenase/oxidase [Aliifodinibius sp. S!AR15-10]MDR8392004.1 glycerol-3-phosphate dehydrogenase/oxidase [Aliifodinibius sp. S!AR15-10]